MPHQNRTVKPGSSETTVVTDAGEHLTPPEDWSLLPPGDGPLTRLVKAKGPAWLVQVKVGRRLISRGIWAKDESIQTAKRELEAKRSAPGYAKRRARELAAKEKKHQEYVLEFCAAVVRYLDFHPRYATLATEFAEAVTRLTTPVGSGTVARTERIPLEERAQSAVIAWMRHQTTGYDRMTIARIKGNRRQVRRDLAAQAVELLQRYRAGADILPSCPLLEALKALKE
jgi:hypothetical protein